jgi:predicted kinase
VGPLRGTGTKAQTNRVYTVMFSNEGRLIQKGSKVTVVIGEFKAENLVVE